MKFIGMDIHSATFTVAVMHDRGGAKLVRKFDTSEANLIKAANLVTSPKTMVVEETGMAEWVKAVVDPYVDRLIICDPRENRWIAGDEFIDDARSATKLADLARMGKVKEVYHPEGSLSDMRDLFITYHHLSSHIIRSKNQLKAVFRRVGICTKTQSVYEVNNRDKWLARLDQRPELRFRAVQLYHLMDLLEEEKKKTKLRLSQKARKHAAYQLLKTIPGVGSVIAAGYLAMIVTPERFSRKNKLWRYAGFSNVRHDSDGKLYRDGPSRSGNRILKWLVSQQFRAAVLRSRKANSFKTKYLEMTKGHGSKRVARRHVCRAILSVTRAVWMKGEPYNSGNMTSSS